MFLSFRVFVVFGYKRFLKYFIRLMERAKQLHKKIKIKINSNSNFIETC